VCAAIFIAVIINFVSLPHSTNQPYVLWTSWKDAVGICCNGYFGEGLL